VENIRRQAQPSVSIEQAAKPSFDITVGDPHKVGDLTSSHIVYQVRTKVGIHHPISLDGIDVNHRQARKHTSNESSPLAAATGTSFGSTTHYTITTQALSFHPHQKNKPLGVLIPILLNHAVQLLSEC
jgi:hypothetical protein